MTGRPPPAKPWERKAGATSADAGAPKPWDKPIGAETTVVSATGDVTTSLGGPSQPGVGAPAARPWEAPSTPSTSYGAGAMTNTYGSGSMYGRPAGGMYGSTAGGMYGTGSSYGGMYGGTSYGGTGGMYGGSSYGGGGMYGSQYGGAGGMYGSQYGGGGGMYGRPGGMYGSGGGMYGAGAGVGMYGAPGGMLGNGPMDPNNPHAPPQPPSGWQAMLAGLGGLMHFFGRLSFLVDENAHAVHFFVSALLQLLDRAGSLYGELARFILRLLGVRRAKKASSALVPVGAGPAQGAMPAPQASKALPAASVPWEGVWQKQA